MSDEKSPDEKVTGRRNWLTGMIPAAADTVATAIENKMSDEPPRRRPPGAVHEPLFLMLCTKCSDCVYACPPKAIHTFLETAGKIGGTPVMRPDKRACLMCDGFPCAAACQTGALKMPEKKVWRLGKVRLNESDCFAFMGPECGACVGICPDDLRAMRLVGNRPVLSEEHCIGCGICIEACPTTPKAIVLQALVDGE